jgi:hypothetical protein
VIYRWPGEETYLVGDAEAHSAIFYSGTWLRSCGTYYTALVLSGSSNCALGLPFAVSAIDRILGQRRSTIVKIKGVREKQPYRRRQKNVGRVVMTLAIV